MQKKNYIAVCLIGLVMVTRASEILSFAGTVQEPAVIGGQLKTDREEEQAIAQSGGKTTADTVSAEIKRAGAEGYNALAAKVDALTGGQTGVFTIKNNLYATKQIKIKSGVTVKLQVDGTDHYIARYNYDGMMFKVENGGKLILAGSGISRTSSAYEHYLVLDGNGPGVGTADASRNQGSIVYNNGTFVMRAGSKIREGSSEFGGGVNSGEENTNAVMYFYGGAEIYNCVTYMRPTEDNACGAGIKNTGMLYLYGGAVHHCTASRADGKEITGSAVWNGGKTLIGANPSPANAGEYGDGSLLLYGNSAVSGGGAIQNVETGTLTINAPACKIYQNKSEKRGGAIGNVGTCMITGAQIYDNHADKQGGAIVNTAGASLDISSNAVFLYQNTAGAAGGAVFTNGALRLTDCGNIYRNTAGSSGGAVMADEGTAVITNCKIYQNTAAGSGSAVGIISKDLSSSTNGAVTISGGEMTGNICNARYADAALANLGTCTVSDTLLNGNSGVAVTNGFLEDISSQEKQTAWTNASAKLTLQGTAIVKGNGKKNSLDNGGILLLQGGSITNGRDGIHNTGTVKMTGGSIKGNVEHGVYQNGEFQMSGAAKVDTGNDVCLADQKVIHVNGALTTSGLVAAVTPTNGKNVDDDKAKVKTEKGTKVVTTTYAGGRGSAALFYKKNQCRFVLSNGGVLRPGDYMDRTVLAEEKHTKISNKDIVISTSYAVTYEKNIEEKDAEGQPVDVEVADLPESQEKFWCEDLKLPNADGSYTDPSVSAEPYASYYRFLNWNEKADGTGNAVVLPQIYKENRKLTVYALWQNLFNVAYIGNGQSDGEDFTDPDISRDSTYTFNGNEDGDGTEHFEKEVKNTYKDEETGEEVEQETTAKVVQWSLYKEDINDESVFDLDEEMMAGELYSRAEKINGAITIGAPSEDYGLFSKAGSQQVRAIQEFRGSSLFVAAPAGQQYINLYAVWDYGPTVKASDLYYTLEEAQNTTDTTGITMEELLSCAEATDEEDGTLAHGKDMELEGGKKTAFIVSDYAASEFFSFTAAGSVTINYRAVDSVGNITNQMVTVHIVDTKGRKVDKGKVRFISRKYLDTLSEDSIWKVDSAYYEVLTAALDNKRENTGRYTADVLGEKVSIEKPGSGTWATPPEQTWVFTHEQVEQVKTYVDTHGIGNSKSEGALKGFLKQFAFCRK